MADITSLLTPSEMEAKLKGVITAERLVELAESRLAPHYTIDERIMFGPGEMKEWLNHNMLIRHAGKHLGNGIITLVSVTCPPSDEIKVPISLRAIAGMIIPLSLQSSETPGMPGVYFLCSEGEVVYVGQSGNVFGRVGAHIGNKTFDAVFFVRVPQSDLDYVEGELIRTLKPKYNHDKKGRIVAPYGSDESAVDSSLECVCAVRLSLGSEEESMA